MIFLLILVGFIILGIFLEKILLWEYGILGFVFYIISSITLFLALIFLPLSYFDYMAEIKRYDALKETIKYSRDNNNISEYERAAILNTIAEYNQKLASAKYWNNTIFDIYIPDEFAELEPLR